MEITKNTFDQAPQLITNEGKGVMVCFDITEREVDIDTIGSDEEKTAKRTVWEAYSVRVQQPISRDKVVDAIVCAAYPSDRMQAILNNHLANIATKADGNELDEDEQEHETEYVEMQAWRKKAKEVAKEAIESYLEGIAGGR